jgi:methylamine--corrinoid protein Co-methyltransferase
MINIYEIWERAEKGPICRENDFYLRLFYPRVKELVKEYDIKYDPEMLLPTDESLIDDVYKAGMSLAIDVGLLCTDTERIIKFEESEIKDYLRNLPGQFTGGSGRDTITVKQRGIEDKEPPVIGGAPMGAPVSEHLGVKVYMSYAQEPIIDYIGVLGATLETVRGMKVRAGAPSELYASQHNIAMMREATRWAQRPGMPISPDTFVSLASDIVVSFPGYLRKTDFPRSGIRTYPVMKVSYDSLCRAAHYLEAGFLTRAGSAGGSVFLSGSPEAAVITSIALVLALGLISQAVTSDSTVSDNPQRPGHGTRVGIWGTNLAIASKVKNTNSVDTHCIFYSNAGPCTDMYLYQIAAMTIGSTVVGGNVNGACGLEGRKTDYFTGFDARFMGEVAHASVSMKMNDANEMIKELLSKYEDRIENPPLGKRFQECYDVKTVTPSKEYLDLYTRVKKELEDMGLEFRH